MLVTLSIRDVVLIDRLDLSFQAGLGVLTGETGAGKSILLDSLGLALGARAESGLVRRGARQLSVTAEFDLATDHPARALLAEQGIAGEGDAVLLRRIVSADGRSRASINDQPASIGLLRKVGDLLVEVHGQFESHGLLDPDTHCGVLDAFAGLEAPGAAVRSAWRGWREAAKRRSDAEAQLAKARGDEDLLRHALDELAALDARPGEETQLAERRTVMQHGEKLLEAMNTAQAALSAGGGVEKALQTATRALERVAERAEGRLDGVVAALDRAALEAGEAVSLLERASGEIDLDPRHLEQVEERLFALRAAARKHGVAVDELDGLRRRFAEQLASLDAGGDHLGKLAEAERSARAAYVQGARALSALRQEAAARLDAAVAAELPPLKLDRARFVTRVTPRDEPAWDGSGVDTVAFEVATNPGATPGPLGKIVSGGELSRLMLALKVVLARVSPVPTIVFDEVDSGIGGAVAAAVGERLARLAHDLQILVVTHSPQVAAKGDHHWRVAKHDSGDTVVTRVEPLATAARLEEIARMLAGETVTEQARAAAASLMGA